MPVEKTYPATVRRSIRLPDPLRVSRCLRAPELGPRMLFFSGGSALRALSRKLKHYTHNTVHLITPYDSGGSSAKLRDAFNMPSVGDLRNRLMALADETVRGSPEIYALFSHRLPTQMQAPELRTQLLSMVEGTHSLVVDVPEPMRRIVRTHLRDFCQGMPPNFDLRGASIGNLILAGGYLANERDLESVIFTFSRLVEARGQVRLISPESLQLCATLEDGQRVVGQHRLTGKEVEPLTQPIRGLSLVSSVEQPAPASADISARNKKLIARTDLLCYPMGSFFSSIAANLLPRGVGQAITAVQCPKVYIPNTGVDPEQLGYDTVGCVDWLLQLVRRDAGPQVLASDIVDLVLVDTAQAEYASPIAVDELRDRGLQVVNTDLVDSSRPDKLDPTKLAEALVAIA